MAPKRANPIEVPPAASSGEEDEDEATSSDEKQGEERSSSSEEEEEEDDPKTQSSPLIQKNPPTEVPEITTPSVANEDSEESGSGSDSESDAEKPIVKPIAMKPMMDFTVKASSSKRPRESDQGAKQPKKKAGEVGSYSASTEVVKKPGEDAKKHLFQRLFSEDDEIALLKGMLDYSAKKGADPCADMNAFYDFVKKSIQTDVTKAQLMDKVRRLKKKFENNAGKGKKGEDRTFSKAHEHNAFELSKKIWGKEGISGKVESSAAKLNGKAKGINKAAVIALKAEITSPNKKIDGGVQPMDVDNKKLSVESSGGLFETRFCIASMEEVVLKHGLDVIDGEKKTALEAKWRNFQIRELELFVERGELINDLAKSMLESYKSKDK